MTAEEEREKLLADLGRQAQIVGGREIYFDWEDFFWDPNDWSEEAARILAQESGLADLTEVHWKVLLFFREYYFYHGRAPMNRHLKEGTQLSLGEIESLFPVASGGAPEDWPDCPIPNRVFEIA